MGRPLNKKYFGNRNAGTAVAGDDGIGGNQVASVTLGTLGSFTTRPTVTFSDPDKLALGGVRAQGTVTSEVLSAAVTVAGTNYVVGDLLTVTTAGGSAIAYVASVDTGGEVLTVNFTGTGASRGSFEALPSGAQATTDNSVAGAGATLTLTFRAKAVVITNAGSGYTDATDAAATFTQSVTGTTVLGTSAVVGQNENAISMIAYLTGGSAGAVDIIRQVSTNRYKVTDGTRTGIVALTSTEADAAGEGSILATDSAGGTYYVTKLTAHKATLTRGTGTQFATGQAIQWTFDAATEGTTVKIANA